MSPSDSRSPFPSLAICLLTLGLTLDLAPINCKNPHSSILHAQEGANYWLRAFIEGDRKNHGDGVSKLELLKKGGQKSVIRCSGKHLTSLSAIGCSTIDECIAKLPCLVKRARLMGCADEVLDGLTTSTVNEKFIQEYRWTIPENFEGPGMVACKSIDASHPYQKKTITTLDLFFRDMNDEVKLASTISERELIDISVSAKVNSEVETSDWKSLDNSSTFSQGDDITISVWTCPFFLQNDVNSTQFVWTHRNGAQIPIEMTPAQSDGDNEYLVEDFIVPRQLTGFSLSVPWRPEIVRKESDRIIYRNISINVISDDEAVPESTTATIANEAGTTTILPQDDVEEDEEEY